MEPCAVVEANDVILHIALDFGLMGIAAFPKTRHFQIQEEIFRHYVIPAIAFPAHVADKAMLSQDAATVGYGNGLLLQLINETIAHFIFRAKKSDAFLRNSFHPLQREAEFYGSAMEILDNSVTIVLFIVTGSAIHIGRTKAHRVVEMDGDFSRGSGDSFGLDNVRRDPVGGLAGVRRQHLAAADLAARREDQPRREVLFH